MHQLCAMAPALPSMNSCTAHNHSVGQSSFLARPGQSSETGPKVQLSGGRPRQKPAVSDFRRLAENQQGIW